MPGPEWDRQLAELEAAKAAAQQATAAAEAERRAVVEQEAQDDALGWCIVELMGHRRLAGRVSEQEVAGAAMLRLDIPGDPPIYCITPTTEDIVRRLAARQRPTPVSRYELDPAEPPPFASAPADPWMPED